MNENWHLDKRIPIALIMTLVLQTMGALWWAATMTATVGELQRQVTGAGQLDSRLVRVETKVEIVQDGVKELKELIRALPQKLNTGIR